MNATKEKEIDIVKVFLLIEEKDIDRAVNKVYYVKLPKRNTWKLGRNTEGM